MHPMLFGFICLSIIATAAVAMAAVCIAARRRAEHQIARVVAAMSGSDAPDVAAVTEDAVEAACAKLRWERAASADLAARQRDASLVASTAIRLLDPADVAVVLRHAFINATHDPWGSAAERILSVFAFTAATAASVGQR